MRNMTPQLSKASPFMLDVTKMDVININDVTHFL